MRLKSTAKPLTWVVSPVVVSAPQLQCLNPVQREGSWTLAVARYHAGPRNIPAQKRYVCAVIRNMVASGFGEWTDNARTFCA
jgi:hypothetical protein